MKSRRLKAGTENIARLLALLDQYYPYDTKCFLDYETPWQLLVATILSAQCTDARVNMVTPGLFAKYPDINALAEADLSELSADIRPTGFFSVKAKHIIESMRMLRDEFNGVMPNRMEDLLKFPGVGRKTANVILCHVYGIPGVVVDTHVKRVSGKLGLTKNDDPERIEYDLMEILPKEHWIRFNTQIIAHGRAVCTARKPQCADCGLYEVCGYNKKP